MDNLILLGFCENQPAGFSLDIDHTHLRPRGTVSGTTNKLLNDTAMYEAILIILVPLVSAVTINLNLFFLRKAELHSDLLVGSWLMKVGNRVIVGEVIIYLLDDPKQFVQEKCVYSIFPQSIQTKVTY